MGFLAHLPVRTPESRFPLPILQRHLEAVYVNSKEHFQGFILRGSLEARPALCFPQLTDTLSFPSPLASLSPSHGGPKVQDRKGTTILGWISAREPGALAGVDLGRWLFGDIKDLQLATKLADS